jgi:hypothetical protein
MLFSLKIIFVFGNLNLFFNLFTILTSLDLLSQNVYVHFNFSFSHKSNILANINLESYHQLIYNQIFLNDFKYFLIILLKVV